MPNPVRIPIKFKKIETELLHILSRVFKEEITVHYEYESSYIRKIQTTELHTFRNFDPQYKFLKPFFVACSRDFKVHLEGQDNTFFELLSSGDRYSYVTHNEHGIIVRMVTKEIYFAGENQETLSEETPKENPETDESQVSVFVEQPLVIAGFQAVVI
jgi:hypothetical protein